MLRFQKIVFILFSSLVFAILAMMLSRFFIPKNVGLAGGAMVLLYGLFGLILGLVVSLVLRNRLSMKFLQLGNTVCALFLIICGVKIYQHIAVSKAEVQKQRARYQHLKHTPTAQPIPGADEVEMGIGIAQVHLKAGQSIYFYNKPQADQLAEQLSPMDSITFQAAPHGIDIATAPPWLVPEKLKLDYQIFHFLVIAQHRSYLQVVVNKTNGKTAWMSKSQLSYQDWSSFLLGVSAIAPLDWDNNPLRIKPLTHASPLLEIDSQYILQPLTIEGDWIEVSILDHNRQASGKGWLRWRSNTMLLISYDLLS
jgi:hypothetical protein